MPVKSLMLKSKYPNKKLGNKGQGLIEVIVSLGLIVVGLVAILTMATFSIKAGTQSSDRIQAALLAQEGIERVKNIRDTNWIDDTSQNKVGWITNNFPENFLTSHSGSYQVATYNDDAGWSITSGTEQIWGMFTRTITFPDVIEDHITISSRVTWTDNSGMERSVEAIGYINNWMGTKD
jgi:Tfp pilus assembly protein PilV